MVDAIPLELLSDSIKVLPDEPDKDKDDSWSDGDSTAADTSYTIDHVRVDPAAGVSVQSVGSGTTVTTITGNYMLFVDAANSTPLARLPNVNDHVVVSSTGQKLLVKSFDPTYDFGNHIHHWEGVLS
ncbi:putative minor capsid protein [Furfurilactobacillus sp. WILCCON 0119]